MRVCACAFAGCVASEKTKTTKQLFEGVHVCACAFVGCVASENKNNKQSEGVRVCVGAFGLCVIGKKAVVITVIPVIAEIKW